ncbi:hypothetical protein [Streptomyces sp. NPDC001502]|uniref:hypothetical protein n=1 Tax=Streptomyces sp. NPDC001502 TaxID=3364578 RepID=UPI0036C29508
MSGDGFQIATGDQHLARATAQLLGREDRLCRPIRWRAGPGRAGRPADYAGRTTATYAHEQRGNR